jgi:hypothetical protein
VAKQKFKITNWCNYNKALINRGSITFWLDDEAIQAWYESATPASRGRPQRYSDLAITTVLVIKRVFRLTLRAAQGFIDSIFPRWVSHCAARTIQQRQQTGKVGECQF